MKKLTLLLLLAPSVAYADRVGASLELMPSGTIVGGFGGFEGSADAKTAVGFGLIADHDVDPLISVGFAPRFFFGVNTTNSNGNSAEELDLRLRGTVGKEIAPKLKPYLYVAPGYSVLFANDNNNSLHPHGIILGLGGGVSYGLTDKLSGFVELGYQWGFQRGTVNEGGFSTDYKYETRYLGLAVGIADLAEVK